MHLWSRLLGALVLLACCLPAQGQSLTGARRPCTDGKAGGFPCSNIDLLAYLHYRDLGGTVHPHFSDGVSDIVINDIWGWTDAETGREYALVGRSDGTAFVDVSDPINPVYVGELPAHDGRPTMWRDMKVYADHAFVVAESKGHGMQVFDLRQLRGVAGPPVTFAETVHYDGVAAAHNVAVNEETGFAYILGASSGGTTCNGGLHVVDVRTPTAPTFAGCISDTLTGFNNSGSTHDAQCVVYRGPDTAHVGKEICFASNETAVSIIDVTDKATPVVLGRTSYPSSGYVHQGWLTEDHRYFLQDDESDERRERNVSLQRTLTYVWDLENLETPVLLTVYRGVSTSIDHNQYVRGNYVFQANYTSGLRVLDLHDIGAPREVGFFDTFLRNDAVADPEFGITLWRGAWSNYPFFESGIVVVSSVGEGLFVLQPTNLVSTAREREVPDASFHLAPPFPNPSLDVATVRLALDRPQHLRLVLYNALGQPVATVFDGFAEAGAGHPFKLDTGSLVPGVYYLHAVGAHTSAVQRLVRVP